MAEPKKLPTFETILYDEPRPGVARVTLNRPDKRNAQNMQMTYDLNSAFDFAVQQNDIKVIVLAATGQHFSSGHDLSGDGNKTWRDFPIIGNNYFMILSGVSTTGVEIRRTPTGRWRPARTPRRRTHRPAAPSALRTRGYG